MTLEEKVDCLGTRTAIPRHGVPNMGSSEGIHGVVQRGSEAAFIVTPSPLLNFRSCQAGDLARDPRWGRSEEVYSEDPFLTGTMAMSFMKGLQGDDHRLLKNDDAALPLRRESLKSIAVIGPMGDSVHWDWYGGFPPNAVTPLAGIR